jgi:hypothetical protein
MNETDPDYLARLVHRMQYGHLERRHCTAATPMPLALKDAFSWGHPDGVVEGHALGVELCRCPNCGLRFTCFPKPS